MRAFKLTGLAVAVAMGALFTSGCVIDDASGQTSTLQQGTQKAFTPYEMNLAQRALFNVTTQFVDRTITVTNTVTNTVEKVVTNTVEHTIEKAVAVPVPSGFITNTIMVTNIVESLATQTVARVEEVVTNLHQRIVADIDVKLKDGASLGVGLTKMIPGWGELLGAGLLGGLSLAAAHLKKKLTESNQRAEEQAGIAAQKEQVAGTFAQQIQVAKYIIETFATTPQGRAALEKYKGWLADHQDAQGIIDVASKIVEENVDKDSARYIAALATGQIPMPAAPVAPIPVQPQS